LLGLTRSRLAARNELNPLQAVSDYRPGDQTVVRPISSDLKNTRFPFLPIERTWK